MFDLFSYELLNHLYYDYYDPDYWNQNCDPRVLHQWFMKNGPGRLIIISLSYLAFIKFGVRFMEHRKPFQMKLPMLLFNVTLVWINLYFFYESFWWTNYGTELFDFHFPSSDDRSTRTLRIIHLYYYYQLSKFLDYVDTLFLVLRKKNDHITTLHVYHHFSVPIVGWISNWVNPMMPVLGLFTMLNSICHILMYTYYTLSALGPQIRPYLWWKRYITRLQMIQFVIIGLYGLELNIKHKNYPLFYRAIIISQAIIYLVMFGNFYRKSYGQQIAAPPPMIMQQDGDLIENANQFVNGKQNNNSKLTRTTV